MIRTSALSFGVAGFALAAALVAGPAIAAKVYYVDYVSGSDANNGLAPTLRGSMRRATRVRPGFPNC